jgi:hypothetical protein
VEHFGKLSIGGAPAASVPPALSNGKARAAFFLNGLDPNGTFDQRVGTWAGGTVHSASSASASSTLSAS